LLIGSGNFFPAISGGSVTENNWLAMRGLLDIVLAIWLFGRFLWHTSDIPGWRARWAQLTIISILLLVLQWLGVWNWQEVSAAVRLLPVIWPLLVVFGYFAFKAYRLSQRIQQIEFEIDWRREYQEVLMEQLEQNGQTAPPPPQKETQS
jgi:hypothetical protein